MMTPRRVLGLAVDERSIVAVEVGRAHGGKPPAVRRSAEFTMPADEAARKPAALGKALARFLRQNHFSASVCVMGLEARWLVAKEKLLPPAAPDVLSGVLAIAAEREFASEPKDLVFDYTGPAPGGRSGQAVLLVAAPRRTVDDLLATARAAGLTVAAITSSVMALASATVGPQTDCRWVLSVSPGEAELAVESQGTYRLVRRLSASAGGPRNGLEAELRRILALLPAANSAARDQALVVWDASGSTDGRWESLGGRLGLQARACRYPADLGVSVEASAGGQSQCGCGWAAAAALALIGLNGRRPPVDFAHSRLAPRKEFALGRKAVWAAAAGAILVAVGLFLVIRWQAEQREVRQLRQQLEGMRESVAAAKEMVDKASLARGWYDRRPSYLDCLRELTLAFPLEGRVWTTSLAVGEDMRTLLSGKASDEGAVLEVLDRISRNPRFSDVKPLYIREAGGGVREVSFAISLRYNGDDRP